MTTSGPIRLSYDLAVALPAYLRQVIPIELLDLNDHLDVIGQARLHNTAAYAFYERVGMGATVLAARGRSIFDAEQHVRFQSEVRAGDEISVHFAPLAVASRSVRAMSFLVNHTLREVASSLEVVHVHVDLQHRRTVPFDPDELDRLKTAKRTAGLDMATVPLCASMTLRDPAA